MRFTPAVMAASIQIFSVERRGFGTAETTTSWFRKAEVRAEREERSTFRDLEAVGAELVESARWIAVTVKPAVFKAARILEPRLPVAYCGRQ